MAWSARTRLYRPPCKSPKDVTRRRDGRLHVTSRPRSTAGKRRAQPWNSQEETALKTAQP